jgi:hypothetical protein
LNARREEYQHAGTAALGVAHPRTPSPIMRYMQRSTAIPGPSTVPTRGIVRTLRLLGALAACLSAGGAPAQSPATSDWGYYGGDALGQHFSSLDEINRDNVARLVVAWTYRTGERGEGFARASKLTFEATPVLAFGLLYLETGTNIVIALDPESGRERWRFDPHIDRTAHYSEASSRGVSVWESPDPRHGELCRRRCSPARWMRAFWPSTQTPDGRALTSAMRGRLTSSAVCISAMRGRTSSPHRPRSTPTSS